jgi:predicted SPOUT superfamily RNA methylase MTH1
LPTGATATLNTQRRTAKLLKKCRGDVGEHRILALQGQLPPDMAKAVRHGQRTIVFRGPIESLDQTPGSGYLVKITLLGLVRS